MEELTIEKCREQKKCEGCKWNVTGACGISDLFEERLTGGKALSSTKSF